MSFNNPTYQQPGIPRLSALLDAVKRELSLDMNCVKIGTVVSYNATLQEVEVQVAFQRVVSTDPNGVQTLEQYAPLLNVPVYYTGGGGFTLTMPIAAGDECIVLFNDRMIDSWLVNGAGLPPLTGRAHDIADGIALVGLRNNTRALTNVSTTTAQLRSNDGTTYVEVAGGGIVNVVAPTQINMTTPILNVTGVLNVENVSSSATPCVINGNITTNGDVIASTISLVNHVHSGGTTSSGNTGAATG